MIQKFMKRAMCMCPKVREPEPKGIDWVTDFIENPYFLRLRFLPSVQALPETIAYWKVEDDLKKEMKTRGWRTPGEGREFRSRKGKEKFQLFREGKLKPRGENLSYLTVCCDNLPDEAVALPVRIRDRSPERGNYFRSDSGTPILGPKTEKEAAEDQKIEDTLQQHCQRWADQVRLNCCQMPTNRKGKVWTPRWPDEDPDSTEGIRVRIISEFPDHIFIPRLILRKDWAWKDFCLFADIMAEGEAWEAHMANDIWTENDGRTPFPDQAITICPADQRKQEKEEKWQKDADDKWFDFYAVGWYRHSGDWEKPTVPTESGGKNQLRMIRAIPSLFKCQRNWKGG
jgi:hypothetical protein